MKKILLIKKAICLLAVLALAICLTACSSKEDLFSNEDVLRNIKNYEDDFHSNLDAPLKNKISGKNVSTNMDSNFFFEENDGVYSIYSFKADEKIAEHSSSNFEYYNYGDFSYVSLYKEEIDCYEMFDCVGNELLPDTTLKYIDVYLADCQYYTTNDDGSFTSFSRENIYYSVEEDLSIVDKYVSNMLLIDRNIQGDILSFKRLPYEEYIKSTQFKEGDTFQNMYKSYFEYISSSDLDFLYCELQGKMEGYYTYTNAVSEGYGSSSYTILVYNEKDELVNSIYLNNVKYALIDDCLIYQTVSIAPQYSDEFDLTAENDKYLINTYSINIKTGKTKEIDFDYIIQGSINSLLAKNEDGVEYAIAAYASVIEIKDKKLYGDSFNIYFDAKGNILSDDNTNTVFDVTKLDDSHYIAIDKYDCSWILNSEFERITPLGENFYISQNAKVIGVAVDSYINYIGFIDYDGKIIEGFTYTYDELRVSENGHFFATGLDGNEYTLIFENGALSKKYSSKDYDTYDIYDVQYESNIYNDAILNSELLIEIDEELDTYSIYSINGELIKSFEDVSTFRIRKYSGISRFYRIYVATLSETNTYILY